MKSASFPAMVAVVILCTGCVGPLLAPSPTPTTEAFIVPGTEDQEWVMIVAPTPIYSIRGDILAIAPAGRWYRVAQTSPGWILAVPIGNAQAPVWITADERVQVSAGRPLTTTAGAANQGSM